MKVPLSWLREFVAIDADVGELARRLTVAGVEVEAIEHLEPKFSDVFVARVLKVEKHPNADRLSVCEVERRRCGPLQGGVRSAQRQARNEGRARQGRSAARGREPRWPRRAAAARRRRDSRSALGGDALLGARARILGGARGNHGAGAGAPIGAELAAYMGLKDTVLDIAITPNRGDCLSILGLAREIAALFDARLRMTKLAPAASSASAIAPVAIEIPAPELCPRYAALLMGGVKIGPSPMWLRRRLELCGMRPLNSVVDVTNYVMLERGQPLHAFDSSKIEDRKIVVRRAADYSIFTTLDDVQRELDPSDLMIADGKKMLAIAGVMGGLNSEVGNSTSEILLESAYFDPIAIARTSRRLGLRSEASYRFERGIDRQGQVPALVRAASLIAKTAGGKQIGSIIDAEPKPAVAREINLDLDAMSALLGVEIPAGEVRRRLRALGATVESAGRARFKVSPPSFRPDLNEPADLAEEAARIKGLEEIPAVLVQRAAAPEKENPERAFGRRSREALIGCGLTEIKTIAFIAPADNQRFPGLGGGAPVRVANPLSAELSELRLSLLPGLVAALRFNLNRQVGAFHAFEIAKVYRRQSEAPSEGHRLAALSYGNFALSAVGAGGIKAGFFQPQGRDRDLSRLAWGSRARRVRARRRAVHGLPASGTRRADQTGRRDARMYRRNSSARSDATRARGSLRVVRT